MAARPLVNRDVARRRDGHFLASAGKKILLACGIVSSVLYGSMCILAAKRWEGYSSAAQTVSELSAIGSPTRPLWLPLGWAYAMLLAAFGLGVWRTARPGRPLRVVGGLLMSDGILSLGWPPMHQRAVLAAGGGTLTDTLHICWTIVTVLLMLGAIVVGASAFGSRFRLYSVATLAITGVCGALTGRSAQGIQADLPTPFAGVWERISIGAFLLWIVVLALVLLSREAALEPAADLDRPRTGGSGHE
jgi:hypothetical protein